MAYHVLKQAGETLPWIALSHDIDLARKRLNKMLREAPRLPHAERPRARDQYLKQAEELDKLLEAYAFMVPIRRLEQGRFPRRIAAAQWDAAIASARSNEDRVRHEDRRRVDTGKAR
jgi:hypothetical protein